MIMIMIGKTIQTIMFLASCKHKIGVSGPHLVVTPLGYINTNININASLIYITNTNRL